MHSRLFFNFLGFSVFILRLCLEINTAFWPSSALAPHSTACSTQDQQATLTFGNSGEGHLLYSILETHYQQPWHGLVFTLDLHRIIPVIFCNPYRWVEEQKINKEGWHLVQYVWESPRCIDAYKNICLHLWTTLQQLINIAKMTALIHQVLNLGCTC